MAILENPIRTLLLLGALSALLIGIGGLVAPGYLYLFGALAVAVTVGAYFFSDRLALLITSVAHALSFAVLFGGSGQDDVATTPATAGLVIVNPYGARETVSRLFSTRPSSRERVSRLREMAREGARPNRDPFVRVGGLW